MAHVHPGPPEPSGRPARLRRELSEFLRFEIAPASDFETGRPHEEADYARAFGPALVRTWSPTRRTAPATTTS
jgi:hypothetical protein